MPDRAIIVGIQRYPELPPPLEGPKNDAKKFFNWVTTQGGVDRAAGHAKLILEPTRLARLALNARPTEEAIKYQFDLLEQEAKGSPKKQAGDRLYLYLAGHGFGWSLYDASLLMANATQSRTHHHIPGRPWADHFFARGYFKEVLLFLDCCRERFLQAPLNGPGLPIPPAPDTARCFYGFAAKYGKLAVERNVDGQMSGIFTATLLDALTGGASEEDGRVTGETLSSYLDENMKSFLSADDLTDKDIATEPETYCSRPKEFVITRVPPRRYDVTIPLPPGSQWSARQLIGEQGGQKFVKIAEAAGDGVLEWKLQLLRGTYLLVVNGAEWTVTVKGRGVTDVTKL